MTNRNSNWVAREGRVSVIGKGGRKVAWTRGYWCSERGKGTTRGGSSLHVYTVTGAGGKMRLGGDEGEGVSKSGESILMK